MSKHSTHRSCGSSATDTADKPKDPISTGTEVVLSLVKDRSVDHTASGKTAPVWMSPVPTTVRQPSSDHSLHPRSLVPLEPSTHHWQPLTVLITVSPQECRFSKDLMVFEASESLLLSSTPLLGFGTEHILIPGCTTGTEPGTSSFLIGSITFQWRFGQ